MNKEELIKLMIERQIQEKAEEMKKHTSRIDAFIQLCSANNIIVTESDIQYNPAIGIHVDKEGILNSLLIDVLVDKDGLYSLKELFEVKSAKKTQSGFLLLSDYIVIASPLFRRKFSRHNNFAPHFIDLFWSMNDVSMEYSVALDKDRIRIDDGSMWYMEEDTWYGAPFNEDISKISDGVVKLVPPFDLDDMDNSFLFNDAYSVEVKWSIKGDIKTFQAIEFQSEKITIKRHGENYHPARYLHAEYDMRKLSFRHFDGAVQYFNNQDYIARRDSDFNYDNKSKGLCCTNSD
jgi:hypothetical protein